MELGELSEPLQYGTSAPKTVTQFFTVMNIIWTRYRYTVFSLLPNDISQYCPEMFYEPEDQNEVCTELLSSLIASSVRKWRGRARVRIT